MWWGLERGVKGRGMAISYREIRLTWMRPTCRPTGHICFSDMCCWSLLELLRVHSSFKPIISVFFPRSCI